MANHNLACQASARLCERLADALSKKVDHLEYKKGNNKCSIGASGGRKIFAIFAWVTHDSRAPMAALRDPESPSDAASPPFGGAPRSAGGCIKDSTRSQGIPLVLEKLI